MKFTSLKEYFLVNYRDKSYVLQEKAYVYFWVSCIFILLLFCVIIYNIINPSDVSLYINMVNALLMLGSIAALFILRSGKYTLSTSIMIAAFTLLWIAGVLLKMERFMLTGTNSFLYFMFPLMIIVSMFGTAVSLIIVTVIVAALNTFLLAAAHTRSGPDVFGNIMMSSINIYISIAIVYAFSHLVSKITSHALEKTEQELEEKRQLNLTLELKVEERTRKIETAMEELEAMNENLIRTNAELEEAQGIMKMDMKMAVNVQQSFLPKEPPRLNDWDISFAFKPMSGVAGDFYDFYTVNNQLKGVSIFDVSGHGIASGLVTMIAKSIVFRNFIKRENTDLSDIMSNINHDLLQEMENVENYLTGIVLRLAGNGIEYVNAAHPDLIHRHGATGKVSEIIEGDGDNRGTFLGLVSMQMHYPVLKKTINSGDLLVIYTDGLKESFNRNGEQYGIERIMRTLEQVPVNADSRAHLDSLVRGLEDFMDGLSPDDDLTIIALKKI